MTVYIVTYVEFYGDGRRKEFSTDAFLSEKKALAYFEEQISDLDKDDDIEVEDGYHDCIGIIREATVSSPLMFTGEMKVRYKLILTAAFAD